MDSGRSRSTMWLWLLTVALAAGAVALFRSGIAHQGEALYPFLAIPWWALAIGFAVGELHSFELRFRGETHTFSLNEILVVLGLFVLPPGQLLLAQFLGSAVVFVAVERMRFFKFCFNIALLTLTLEISILTFRAIADPGNPLGPMSWLGALSGEVLSSIVGLAAISLAISISEGRVEVAGIARSFAFGVLGAAINTMLGLVVLIVLAESVWAAALLVGPVVMVFVAYRAYLSEHSKTRGLQFLYSASELLTSARDLEAGLLALLNFARETFGADIAEVVLLGEAGETVGYRTSTGPGERSHRLEPVALADVESVTNAAGTSGSAVMCRPAANSVLASRGGVELAYAMVAALTDESGVRGGVMVARPKGPNGIPFEKDELRLFETFANHLGTTMEKSRLSSSLAQLRLLKQELAHQAYHDSLTGLSNRLMFKDLVDEALAAAARDGGAVAVMFIDLDDFKTVNDTMGHAAGDALLREVARRIAESVGEHGTAARLGGDEFAVLLPAVRNDSIVRTVADRILVALGDPVDIEGQHVVAQASIGIATHVGAADASELMANADVAMYTAKRNGKGRFDEFEPNMSLSVAHRHQLKVGLERAIAQDEFSLNYQPVVDVASGTISASEALLRWKDPQRGLLPPTEFVGVAEETGLIVPIGRFVIREACRQGAAWQGVAPGLRIFVNLSTRQLADPDLVADVRAALADAGLPASQLVLEVTETAMMRDIDEAKQTLLGLKGLGVTIAIDDFGTGFSSLSYLRELPIDVLKIAKPIVDAICESPQDAAFVKGIIELGHVVGLHVVAEGVEQVEQYAHLVDMGCDFVQGYYYAPSMGPGDMGTLLATATPVPVPASL